MTESVTHQEKSKSSFSKRLLS